MASDSDDSYDSSDGGLYLDDATSLDELTPSTRTAWETVLSDDPDIPTLVTAINDPNCRVNRVLARTELTELTEVPSHLSVLLVYALIKNKVDAAAALIECPRVYVDEDMIPVMAAIHGSVPCLKALKARGIDLRRAPEAIATPLHIALQEKNDDAALWLLQEGFVDVAAKDKNTCTALHYAVIDISFKGEPIYDIIALLVVVHNADIHAKDKFPSPASKFIRGDHRVRHLFRLWDDSALRALLAEWTPEHPVVADSLPPSALTDLYSPYSTFDTRVNILHWLNLWVHHVSAQALMRCNSVEALRGVLNDSTRFPPPPPPGANPEFDTALQAYLDHTTPLSRRLRLLGCFVDGGACLPVSDTNRISVLPATQKARDMLDAIDYRSPDIPDDFDLPAFMEVINDPLCEVNNSFSPTGIAAPTLLTSAFGWKTLTLAMISCRRVDCEAEDSYGNTPAHLAARKGDLEIVEALAARGVDFRRPTSYHNLPINFAVRHPEVLRYLLQNDLVDVTAFIPPGLAFETMGMPDNGHAPLSWAGNVESARLLLDYGALVLCGGTHALLSAYGYQRFEAAELMVARRGFVRVLDAPLTWVRDDILPSNHEFYWEAENDKEPHIRFLESAMATAVLWAKRLEGVRVGIAAADARVARLR